MGGSPEKFVMDGRPAGRDCTSWPRACRWTRTRRPWTRCAKWGRGGISLAAPHTQANYSHRLLAQPACSTTKTLRDMVGGRVGRSTEALAAGSSSTGWWPTYQSRMLDPAIDEGALKAYMTEKKGRDARRLHLSPPPVHVACPGAEKPVPTFARHALADRARGTQDRAHHLDMAAGRIAQPSAHARGVQHRLFVQQAAARGGGARGARRRRSSRQGGRRAYKQAGAVHVAEPLGEIGHQTAS